MILELSIGGETGTQNLSMHEPPVNRFVAPLVLRLGSGHLLLDPLQRGNHFTSAFAEFFAVNDGRFIDQPVSLRRQSQMNIPAVEFSLGPRDVAASDEFRYEADGSVMFHLKPFAELPDRESGGRIGCAQRQQRLVLLGRKAPMFQELVFAEAQKLPHRIAECGERLVIVVLKSLGH
jgi:hypothetical protein